MMCESRVFGDRGSMYWNFADNAVFPMLSSQSSNAHTPPSLPAIHGMAQDFQQFGGSIAEGGGVHQIEPLPNFVLNPRGLWCFGIQSDAAGECAFLLNKTGSPQWGPKPAVETSVEGGAVVVRSRLCPWANSNSDHLDRTAATDPARYQRLLEDAMSPPDARRAGSGVDRIGAACKYCAALEKALTASLDVTEKWADENWDDTNFKQVDQFFERTLASADSDSRKRKYGPPADWEDDRALVLLKLNELNARAARAEQRVMELEQLLRDHVLVAADDTCDNSDILTALPQHEYSEGHSAMLVCTLAGCNKAFKSSKTLRRHVGQKHSDNARSLLCNQPTVDGVMCRFETIHSGVLSYHRKHSLAHRRREDWHISCPFCHSKFARQHEMERHQRVCKSRPALPPTSLHAVPQGVALPPQLMKFAGPGRGPHHHLHFNMADSTIESSITY